ncbi:MAG: glutamine-synthetase adenylyltransferase [Bdellovibrionaceae bacterium]|nr:glutamine-synthetase adenylyltransferase [Bdellovibrionales bacterium]MCB9085308.1 glutamine-synthetase adenylyltransferase [Pseudobdellovibrionaceae bacterium]
MINKSLPDLSSYSPEEWAEACRLLPAVKRYKEWSDRESNSAEYSFVLRQMRHQAWLRAAMATFFDRSTTSDICYEWSREAEELLRLGWEHCGLSALPVCLLSVGKLGSQELNLSSDVDLIVVSEVGINTEIDRAIKRFRALLADATDLGIVLRLDFDLRPGGRFGPLISTLPQLEDYYWSQGETWERLALVRGRCLFGPGPLQTAVSEVLTKFTYRRFLDYTLLDDLKQLRSRIHQHYQLDTQHEFHLKAGVGGIRDVELFVHALQVLHGGKDRQLRTHSTQKALLLLQDRGILPDEEVSLLETTYWLFRHLEHLVQLAEDRQTHVLSFDSLPRGHRICDKLTVEHLSQRVDHIVSSLLGPATSHEDTLPSTLEGQQAWLSDLGFSEETTSQIWPELMSQTAKSARREKDEKARRQFLFDFITETSKSGLDKSLGISLLAKFTQSIRAKATFFSLFAREPRIVRDLARLFSSSPYLGSILASRPELIDSFVFKFHESFSSDLETCLEQMAEYRLLTEIISANQFLYDKNATKLSQNLSNCADHLTSELLNILDGRPLDQSLQIIAMGKWGGHELGFRSDLDLVFVSHGPPTADDHRLAKRFIHRLTDVHKGGRIYNIDLRLRPSGAAGPLIVSLDGLREFLTQRALGWERQAYLRARPLSQLPFNIGDVVVNRGLSEEDLAELADIRRKLIRPLPSNLEEHVDLKYQLGGLVDIELGLQTIILYHKILGGGPSLEQMIKSVSATQPENAQSYDLLYHNYMDLRGAEQMLQLASNHSGSEILYSSQEGERLAQLLSAKPIQLAKRLAQLMRQSAEILKDLDPVRASS